jgi:hypothetical protein
MSTGSVGDVDCHVIVSNMCTFQKPRRRWVQGQITMTEWSRGERAERRSRQLKSRVAPDGAKPFLSLEGSPTTRRQLRHTSRTWTRLTSSPRAEHADSTFLSISHALTVSLTSPGLVCLHAAVAFAYNGTHRQPAARHTPPSL